MSASVLASSTVTLHDGGDKDQLTLHSWSEEYLSSSGYDPSVADWPSPMAMSAVAAAGQPLLSAPLSGTFRGNAVSSGLHAEIDIRGASADAA